MHELGTQSLMPGGEGAGKPPTEIKSMFITLTYDDKHLPKNGSLCKSDLQLFWKRLRKNSGAKIKYYGAGEYGPKNYRPHYHAIVIGLGSEYEGFTKPDRIGMRTLKEWNLGAVHVGEVQEKSVWYVTDYILGKEVKKNFYKGVEKPFQVVSQGFGKKFALANKEYLETNLNVTMKGAQVGFPRYYRKVLGVKNNDISRRMEERAINSNAEYIMKIMTKGGCGDEVVSWTKDEVKKMLEETREQKRKNLEAKAKLKEKWL